MTENTPLKINEIQNESEQQALLKPLQDTTMTKLKEAIDLNKKSRTKAAWQVKVEACALLLVAIRAGVQFDLNDPVFQIFVQRESWRDAMERACKEVCDPSTTIASNVQEIINMIPSIPVVTPLGCFDFSIGSFVNKICRFFKKDSASLRGEEEAYNSDTWHDFYQDIPKDDGKGSFTYRGLGQFVLPHIKKAPNNKLQAFLAQKMRALSRNSGIQKCLSNRMITAPSKNPHNVKNSQLKKLIATQRLRTWPKKQNISNAA